MLKRSFYLTSLPHIVILNLFQDLLDCTYKCSLVFNIQLASRRLAKAHCSMIYFFKRYLEIFISNACNPKPNSSFKSALILRCAFTALKTSNSLYISPIVFNSLVAHVQLAIISSSICFFNLAFNCCNSFSSFLS